MNGTSFKAYGVNPITGEQILKVTPVSTTSFNNNPSMIWNYDVIMIGTWDSNALSYPSDNAVKIIEEYINSGYGILLGHDTIFSQSDPKRYEMGKLKKYFNIELGTYGQTNPAEYDYNTSWFYVSNYITVDKTGLLTNFPYELPLGTQLTIPATHTNRQAALGNVWMTLVNGTDNFGNGGSINNYYNAGGKGNPCYYLTTWNNTAMIQTGHSNGESTDDERKVLANTLFYLKQRTTATSSVDNSSQDFKAPYAPEISAARIGATSNIKVSYSAKDNGSKYSFYVEAYDANNSSVLLETSNKRTELVTTGTKGYYYIIDNDSRNKDFSITASGVSYVESPNMTLGISNNGKYIHMKAIDLAGNVGEPSVLKIDIKMVAQVTIDLEGGNLDGEEGPIREDILIGNSIKLETPEKEGYTFVGWFTDSKYENKLTGDEYTPEDNVTLYAKWEKDYTITVDNDRNGHTYNSYQVFQGDYYEKENKVEDENGEEKVVKVPILSNIEWGKELQKEIEDGKTHGDRIIELLKENEKDKSEKDRLYTKCETAEDVAKVLQGMPNDGDVIREFTDVVGKYILDNNIPITKGTSELVEKKDENGNVIDINYKITHLDPGYYLVIDADANEKDDAYSRYLIDVVQDVTMDPKSSIPKLKKKVIGNNIKTLVEGTGTSEDNPAQYIIDDKHNTATYKTLSEVYNAEDYDIKFELKSYIPNPDGYSTYKFEIVDILAKGFDLDSKSIKVMLGENEYPKQREKVIKENEGIENKDIEYKENNVITQEIVDNYTINSIVITAENYAEYKKYFEEEGKEYLDGYAESQYGKTLILIEINDLICQIKDEVVTPGQDTFIRYNAKLNGKGEVGNTPNINEAYLKYSNDPYHNDNITQTTLQTTYTYTIDLNLSKIAELKPEIDEMKHLEGAEFEIYSKPNSVENRQLIATITTDELGQALYSSLGAGTYYLKEVKSPEGYNKLREEIQIEVKATCDEFGTITWSIEDKTNNSLIHAKIAEKEGTTIPEIKLQVENTSGFQLPVTGGCGTIIFTVIGFCIMALAVIYLKSNRILK